MIVPLLAVVVVVDKVLHLEAVIEQGKGFDLDQFLVWVSLVETVEMMVVVVVDAVEVDNWVVEVVVVVTEVVVVVVVMVVQVDNQVAVVVVAVVEK